MSKIYNTIIPVVALIRADSPEEAERFLVQYVETYTELAAYPTPLDRIRGGTFESEPVPEEHVLKFSGDRL